MAFLGGNGRASQQAEVAGQEHIGAGARYTGGMSTTISATGSGLHDTGTAALDIRALHPAASFLRILGVNYVHVKTPEVAGEAATSEEAEGDLYLTEYGVPYYQHLMPENWYEPTWFAAKRIRLAGTGTVYRIPTKPLPAKTHLRPSIDLAIKWSRVGQDVPLDTFTLYQNINAEFNTPFEEFALLEELRRGEYGPRHVRILTQKPLAIYVPSQRMQLWQTGRSRGKILARITRRPGVEIDILRSYILIYGWVKGVDAPLVYPQNDRLIELSTKVHAELESKGFVVADHKPTHIIVRPRATPEGPAVRQRNGRMTYALVDYELLARTEAHEDAVRRMRRSTYLFLQRDRFLPRTAADYPADLQPATVLGVPYVYGHCESTGGTLWVVGNDPNLFAYFLPERWRLKRVLLSESARTYYTQTKDRIHLIWKVSRLGEIPAAAPSAGDDAAYQRMCAHGYNTPFEKMALALEMARAGVRTIYPRAIYMTGVGLGASSSGGPTDGLVNRVLDERRFEACRNMLSPDGRLILPIDHDYITLWGYWRGQEDGEATQDDSAWNPLDAAQASAKGIISRDMLAVMMARHQRDMAAAGFEDLNLKPDHILLSYIPERRLKGGADGFPELRHCNFELVRRIPKVAP